MVTTFIDELEFDHIVEFKKSSSIFAVARQNNTGRGYMRIFLIENATVYTRNGRADSWEELCGGERDSVLARIIAAKNYRSVPTYTVNGSYSN